MVVSNLELRKIFGNVFRLLLIPCGPVRAMLKYPESSSVFQLQSLLSLISISDRYEALEEVSILSNHAFNLPVWFLIIF
jgi:hypothetical protein